jgi:septum site-determining protein MinC
MIDDDISTMHPETPPTIQDQPGFQFKGGLVPLTQLELFEYDYRAFNQRLSKLVKQAPSFFRDMPVIINLERLSEGHEAVDFIELTEVCQAYGVYPIAIRGGSDDQLTAALVAGLPQIPTNPAHKAFHQRLAQSQNTTATQIAGGSVPAEQQAKADEPESGEMESLDDNSASQAATVDETSQRAPAKIINHAVRSGQQVYAPRGDLIVIGSVSAGAEILADGNIHVYGTLRGRALAGVKGDQSARIFCQKLEAELISISGHYKMDEDLQRTFWQKTIQATLDGKRLKIEAL